MTTAITTHHPAEVLAISPEGLEVANTYLQLQDIHKVADALDIPVSLVSQYLDRREIKAYIDQVFLDVGFNNRFKIRDAMDAIISKKFEEMDDAGLGSTKDITEILALSHKMTMDILDRQIQLKKLEEKSVKNQVNVQINEGSPTSGSNYGNLIDRLLATNA